MLPIKNKFDITVTNVVMRSFKGIPIYVEYNIINNYRDLFYTVFCFLTTYKSSFNIYIHSV